MSKKWRFSRGQGLVEYALVIILVAVVILLILQLFGISIKDVFCASMNALGSQPATCSASLFQDDFNDLSKWTIISGKWNIKNGQLCNTGDGKIFAPISNVNDYIVTLSGAKLDAGNGYGLFYRATNFGNWSGYSFQYDPGYGGYINRRWYQSNEFAPNAYYKLSNFNYYSQPHDIKMVVQGSTYTAYVDNQLVYTVTDSNNPAGGIGLRTWDSTTVCFDSIRVDPIP